MGWALIRYDCCPYNKSRLVCRHLQREDHVKTPEKTTTCQEGERIQERSSLLERNLGFPTSELWDDNFCCLNQSLWLYSVMATPEGLYKYVRTKGKFFGLLLKQDKWVLFDFWSFQSLVNKERTCPALTISELSKQFYTLPK